jgi:DNA-binding beta-propeller fold protein YncE
MMKILFVVCFLFIFTSQLLWAGGKKEMESVDRGEYQVAKGNIIPPEEIYEDSYVASIDFQYPDPEGVFGVRFYTGNRQVSTEGQEEIILIGIQGRKFTYEDLPTMNQAFVIDKSGSMYQMDKMNWVKESFDVYMNKVREKDFVSLVEFDDTASVVVPSTQMKGERVRERFRDTVSSMVPGGGSNLMSGLQLGYKEVLSNYRKDYLNQVLLLTDGVGDLENMYEMAATYRELGINVTAIGLGEDCDLEVINNIADWGGGGSRFVSSRETMGEIFGTEFGRMVIPAAREVELELYLLQNLKDVRAWGYHAEIEGQWNNYEKQEGKSPVPYGIAADTGGIIYIVDYANNRIQKFDGEGNLLTQWGRLGIRKWDREKETKADRAEGRFNNPRGVAIDSDGYIYVADTGNNRIQKFDSGGTFIAQWGSPGIRESQFNQPSGIGVDLNGRIYVADTGNNRIQKFDSEGKFVAQWGGMGAEEGKFNVPIAVTADLFRNIYVADLKNNRVQIFESDGTFITKLDGTGIGETSFSPVGLAVDTDGNIFIADSRSNKIQKYDIEKRFVTRWGSYGREDIQFGNLSSVAVNFQGNVYVADTGNNRIQMFDPDGTIMIKQPIRFFLPTVNLGDFETIVIKATIPKQDGEGSKSIARLKVAYTDIDGKRVEMSPIDLTVKFVSTKNPVQGVSNSTVLKAVTMLHYAQALKKIGYEYYDGDVQSSLHMTNEIKKELNNARERLGDNSFENELSVLEKYITIIGAESGLGEEETTRMIQDTELAPPIDDRDIAGHLSFLFEEMVLDLKARKAGNVALFGFSFPDDRHTGILDLIDKTAESYLFKMPGYRVIERERIDGILFEQELSLSDLRDTDNAVRAGRSLSAHYVLTGTVIEMTKSIVIFCRVINVETAVIESIGQVIVPRTEEVNALL